MPILRKLRTLGRLPAAEWWAFLEAAFLLVYAVVLIQFVPFARWRNQVAVSGSQADPAETLTEPQRRTARMVMRTIERVDRNVPIPFVCLPQALAARWMLSRRGIPTELRLGTLIAASEDREFHAWLKAGDIMITGHCDEADYAVLGSQRRS